MYYERWFYVYILTNRSRTLYTGVTGDLKQRVWEHKTGACEGFTKKYKIDRLVYYEIYKYVNSAIAREKQIKRWSKNQKNPVDCRYESDVERPGGRLVSGVGEKGKCIGSSPVRKSKTKCIGPSTTRLSRFAQLALHSG